MQPYVLGNEGEKKWKKKWNSGKIYAFYKFLVRLTIAGKNERLSLFLSYIVQRRIETGI